MIKDLNQILVEWSYRTSDGKPDVKNKAKLLILENVLNDFGWGRKARAELLNTLIEAPKQKDDKIDPDTIVKYKDKDGEDKEAKYSYASRAKEGTPAKIAADKLKGSGGDKKDGEKLDEPSEFDRDVDSNKGVSPDFKRPTGGEESPKDGDKKEPSEEQTENERQRKEFILDITSGLLEQSTEKLGVGRFNMSREDLQTYESYLKGKKPNNPNYDISDEEVDEVIGVLKSTLGEDYTKFVQRVRKKGDPPTQYSKGEAGKKRFFTALKHYMQIGGRSSITGEFVPFSESQLDHVTSLDNGGVDAPENWEWMESRFNQFKGALSDEGVMNKIKKEISKSPDEEKLKTLQQSFRKYSKESMINYYDKKFKEGGTAGLTEKTIDKLTGEGVNALIKGWNKSHPEDSEFFVARYGNKKDDTGKSIDRKSGRASGGRLASKPELIKRFLEKSRASGLDIPTEAESDMIDKDFELIAKELETQKGKISKLKQKIKKSKG